MIKKTKISILTIFLSLMMLSCADIRFGDASFSEPPESSGATLDSLFNSAVNSERVLTTAYIYLPYGVPLDDNSIVSSDDGLGYNGLEMITDLFNSWKNWAGDGPKNLYYNGSLSANISSGLQGAEAHRFGAENQYTAIRYAWIYIENAHKIPDITDATRKIRIAEAKMIIALSYFEMLRYVGGVPLLKGSVDVTGDLNFPRNTFSETVEYIVELLDEAAADLPWVHANQNIDGARMTSAAAMALKLRLLCFVASDTFNSDTLWHPEADEYTCYTNYSADRWTRAYDAGKAFFNELSMSGTYALVQPASTSHMDRRLAYRKAYLETGTTETLISVRKGFDSDLNDAYINFSAGPTLNYVDMFPWEDGTDFDSESFDWEAPSRQPFFEADGTPTRDPRLYETVVVPGDLYESDEVAPVHLNHPSTLSSAVGSTGFLGMKFVLQRSSDRNVAPHWSYLRLAEAYLNYAEAINESKKNPSEAYEYINKVRNRVGLSMFTVGTHTHLQFRELLIKERALELGNEEVRWFDLIRWGRSEDFTKTLYILESVGIDDATSPKEFVFKKKELPVGREWANGVFDTKWYLTPIPQTEINKGYGMTQNPGW